MGDFRRESSCSILEPRAGKTQRWLIALCVMWGVCVATGFVALAAYKSEASDLGTDAPRRFPVDAPLARVAGKPTLLMFVHPRCACSRASLAELERVLHKANSNVQTWVVLQADSAELQGETDITRKAHALPNVEVVVDVEGKEARRFQAMTSGHTLLYAADGELLFSGGLTNTRGHEGPSFGQEHLLSLLSNQARDLKNTEIFGCSLSEKEKTRP